MIWVVVADLVGAPGMPSDRRNVRLRAQREGWQTRKRTVGKGYEFHISSLPQETQQYLKEKYGQGDQGGADGGGAVGDYAGQARTILGGQDANQISLGTTRGVFTPQGGSEVGAGGDAPAGGGGSGAAGATGYVSVGGGLDGSVAQTQTPVGTKAEARFRILTAFADYEAAREGGRVALQYQFVEDYKRGAIPLHRSVYDLIPKLSRATLTNWERSVKSQGTNALSDNYGKRRGDTAVDRQEELRDFIVAMLVEFPQASNRKIYEAAQGRIEMLGLDLELPSQATMDRWIAGWKRRNESLWLYHQNPDQWRGSRMVAFGDRYADIVRLNQLWELDSSPADLICEDGRYSLISCVDIFSRRMMLWVSRTSTAVAVASVLRRCLLDWGVPEVIKTDNGADYTSFHIQRVIRDLGATQDLCEPFSPWEKPAVERGFRTFAHDLVPLLPGFCGHNVAEREAIRARNSFANRLMKRGTVDVPLTRDQLQAFCDQWVTGFNGRLHGTTGVAPLVRVAEAKAVKRIADERLLDVLLSRPIKGGTRVARKDVGLAVDGRSYIAPELLIGQRYEVREDEADLGRVWVFDEAGAFVCVAVCPEVTGVSRQEIAVAAKTRQRATMTAGAKELRRIAKAQDVGDIAQEILTARERRAAKIVPFPTKEIDHESAGIEAAKQAVESLKPKKARPLSPQERARQEELVNEQLRAAETRAESLDQRFGRLYLLKLQGVALSDEDRGFVDRVLSLDAYPGTRQRVELDYQQHQRHA